MSHPILKRMKAWPLSNAVLAALLSLLSPRKPEVAAQEVELPQDAPLGGYERLYGQPVGVPLEDVARGNGYDRKVVRTQGSFGLLGFDRGYYELREGARIMLIPTREVDNPTDLQHLFGREVEVVGLVRRIPESQAVHRCGPESQCQDPELPPLPDRQGHGDWPYYSITFWSIVDITVAEKGKKIESKDVTLENLVTKPGGHDGKTVRVVGKFRGRNLYGDLPIKSQRASSDWVIKDDLFAVWVTGKKPKGQGWELDTNLKRDTGKWIEVVGRPDTRNGVTYVRALRVALGAPPTPSSQVQPPSPPPERPKVPPVIVFAIPLDGERDLARDSRFVVQFSKDMDEATFKERVQLRYAGPVLPGDRTFDGLTLSYDQGRRALTVDPGDLLRPGRLVELLLMPGIADLEGLLLTPRPGKQVEGPADILRFEVVR